MTFSIWCVVGGVILVVMALARTVLKRLPLSAAMIYLGVGYALSPAGAGLCSGRTRSRTPGSSNT